MEVRSILLWSEIKTVFVDTDTFSGWIVSASTFYGRAFWGVAPSLWRRKKRGRKLQVFEMTFILSSVHFWIKYFLRDTFVAAILTKGKVHWAPGEMQRAQMLLKSIPQEGLGPNWAWNKFNILHLEFPHPFPPHLQFVLSQVSWLVFCPHCETCS